MKTIYGMCAYTLTALGILFLLRDLGVWDFWNIQWWTALILLAGLCGLGSKGCCGSCCEEEMPKKKR